MDLSTDQSNGPLSNIYSYSASQGVKLVKSDSGSNGLYSLNDWLIVANHATQTISKLNVETGEIVNLTSIKLNSPNDLVLNRTGAIYFTDPNWQLGRRERSKPFTGVYLLQPNGQQVTLSKAHKNPKGIVLSVDEQFLYVGDAGNTVWKYRIDEHGRLEEKRVFATIESPDGMAIDCEGNVLVASHNTGNLIVLNNRGDEIGRIFIAPKVTNAAHGGPEGKTLLVTTGSGLFLPTSSISSRGFCEYNDS
ncbi:SMP-30/gluconolactonase/LRE family protein [Alteromonas sp. SM 2104]|nr:SMP-30/gluconolactonase/LRE family protein [Alteromonas oceanisediminis]